MLEYFYSHTIQKLLVSTLQRVVLSISRSEDEDGMKTGEDGHETEEEDGQMTDDDQQADDDGGPKTKDEADEGKTNREETPAPSVNGGTNATMTADMAEENLEEGELEEGEIDDDEEPEDEEEEEKEGGEAAQKTEDAEPLRKIPPLMLNLKKIAESTEGESSEFCPHWHNIHS